MSWHGLIHAFAPVTGFMALIAACFVFARRFAGLNQRGWAAYSAATGVAAFALSVLPNVTWNFLPLWIATALGFGWASVMAARLLRRSP
jgi:hypothetical protein